MQVKLIMYLNTIIISILFLSFVQLLLAECPNDEDILKFTLQEEHHDSNLENQQAAFDQRITSLAFHPFNHSILIAAYRCWHYYDTTCTTSNLVVFDTVQGKLLRYMDENAGHGTAYVNSVVFTQDGLLISGSADETIKVWNISYNEDPDICLETYTTGSGVKSVASSALGTYIAAGLMNNGVNIYNTITKSFLRTLNADGGDWVIVAFSPVSDTTLVTFTFDYNI